MKNIVVYLLVFLYSICGFSQHGISSSPGTVEEIAITNSHWSPAPAAVGETGTATFALDAWQGITLNSNERIEVEVCFKKLDWAKLALTPPSAYYETTFGGSADFVAWEYKPTQNNCWTGKVTQNVNKGSQAVFTFNDLVVKESATPQETDANNGVGFSVTLKPHTKDKQAGNNKESVYTFTSEGAIMANLAINMAVSNAAPKVGEVVKFTVSVTNNGPDNATGVNVNGQLPSGYTLQKATTVNGTYTAPTWLIGNLTKGTTATLTVEAKVNASGDYTYNATVSGNETDPNTGDNQAQKGITPSSKCPPGVNCLTFTITTLEKPADNGSAEKLKKDIIGKWNVEGSSFQTKPATQARMKVKQPTRLSGGRLAVTSNAKTPTGGFIEFFADGTFIIYDAQSNFYTGNYYAKDATTIDLSNFGTINDILISGTKIDFTLTFQQSGTQRTLQIKANRASLIPISEKTKLLCRTWELEYWENKWRDNDTGLWREHYWKGGKYYIKEEGVWKENTGDSLDFSSLKVTFSEFGTYLFAWYNKQGKIIEDYFDVENWKWHPTENLKLVSWIYEDKEPMTESEIKEGSIRVVKLTEYDLELLDDLDDDYSAQYRFKAGK